MSDRVIDRDRPLPSVLVVEDEPSLRQVIVDGLEADGFAVAQALDGADAFARLHGFAYDALVVDLRLPDANGMDVLEEALTLFPTIRAVVITGFGTVNEAVTAIKRGAIDFLIKPFQLSQLSRVLRAGIEQRQLRQENAELRAQLQTRFRFDNIIGCSPAMRTVFTTLELVAPMNSTILIEGETGTGKELIAGATHHNSLRASRNFVKVNCAALQENLLESELFGHEKGAFTGADKQRIGRFEQADGGTLFLDEIGDMSASTQAKILRVLQEHEFERLGGTRTLRVDVRLIAATNRDLNAMVQAAQFREDLYYRLNVVSIEMPPLRERKEDIVPLANAFIRKFAGELKKKIDGIEPEAQKMLMRYNWPGNIRELENTIERAMLLAEGRAIASGDLRLGEVATPGSGREQAPVVKIPPTGIPLEDIERHALIEALKMSNWVQKDAAELLSISPRVMNYKIKTLGIEFPRGRRAAPAQQPPPPQNPPIAVAS
jgi:DNA-binding NtrC family response regulator